MPRSSAETSVRMARKIWKNLSREALARLAEIAGQYNFSVAAGDLTYLDGGWYVTHTGLLGLARRKRCAGIHVEPVPAFCDASLNGGHSRQQCTRPTLAAVLLDMVMPILQMFLL